MSKIFEPATDFKFTPADFVPFKDRELCEKLRKISGKDLEKHPNPDFNIKVMMNPHPVLIATLFSRIKEASEKSKKITLILGNPEPETYIPLAQLINYFKVDCRNVHIFAMDEWADENGNIAPGTYKAGFAHSMLKYLVYEIDEKLRMPLSNVHYPTNKNINSYSDMITDCGGRRGYLFFLARLDGTYGFYRPRQRVYDGQHGRISLHESENRYAASAYRCAELASRRVRTVRIYCGRPAQSCDDRTCRRQEREREDRSSRASYQQHFLVVAENDIKTRSSRTGFSAHSEFYVATHENSGVCQ